MSDKSSDKLTTNLEGLTAAKQKEQQAKQGEAHPE